jgi:hypothetical protein
LLHRSGRGRSRDRSPAIPTSSIVGIPFANSRTVACRERPSMGASQGKLVAPGAAQISTKGFASRSYSLKCDSKQHILMHAKTRVPGGLCREASGVVTNSCSYGMYLSRLGSLPADGSEEQTIHGCRSSLQKCLRQLAAARMHKGRVSPRSRMREATSYATSYGLPCSLLRHLPFAKFDTPAQFDEKTKAITASRWMTARV